MSRTLSFLLSFQLDEPHTATRLDSWSPSSNAAYLSSGYGRTVGVVVGSIGALYLIFSLLSLREILLLWLVAEGLFLFINAYRCWNFNRQTVQPEPDLYLIRSIFEKFLDSILSLDVMEHLKDWIVDDSFANLPKENILDLISYAFAYDYRTRESNSHSGLEQLLGTLLHQFQQRTGFHFRDGREQRIRFRSHLWENLRIMHYPLILYLILELFDVVFACLMATSGFLCASYERSRYFLHAPSIQQNRHTILFLHGLGIGAVVYYPFIWLLCQMGHPILVLEMRHLSLRLCFAAPSVDDLVSDVEGILARHRIDKVIVIGHSYGTFIASRFNSLNPTKVVGMCLLDPVCCVMHNPKLLCTFVYGKLRWNSLRSCVHSAILTLLSHDPSISTSVSRNFRWTQLNLWPEDIPQKTLLVLSNDDALVPNEDVQLLFKKTNARVIIHPYHAHGSFLGDHNWQLSIVQHIRETMR